MTTPPDEHDESEVVYALRLSRRAQRDRDDIRDGIGDATGHAAADAWEDGLFEALGTLAHLPERRPAVPEAETFAAAFGPGTVIRELPYRRKGSRVTYRVLFFARKGGADEGPTVTVVHIRHGSQAPIDEDEARRIEMEKQP